MSAVVDTVPLFPLGTVLLPGASLPLHIFEPRYRQLTIDLVTGALPGKQFGVVAVREGWSPDDGREGLHDVGCTASLREVRRLPDGRFDLQTTGDRRFRLLDVDDSTAPYLVANVEWLPDDEGDTEADLAPLAMAARAAHRRYCDTAWKNGDWSEPDADIAADVLPHVLAADCLLPLEDRQALLEELSPVERLRTIRMLLARETGLLTQLRAVPTPASTFAVDQSPN